MLLFKESQAAPLSLQAGDGSTALFARAKVYNADGSSLLATVSMPHVANGLYVGLYTPGALGFQNVQFQFFSDAGFTIPASYDIGSDQIRVLTNDEDTIMTSLLLVKTKTDALPPDPADASDVAAGITAAINAIETFIGTAEGATIAADIKNLRKILKNFWLIDRVAKKIIIYDDDGVTPFLQFLMTLPDGTTPTIGSLQPTDVHGRKPL